MSDVVAIEDSKQIPLSVNDRPITSALTNQKVISGEYYYIRSDKTKFPISLTVTPLMKQNKLYLSLIHI